MENIIDKIVERLQFNAKLCGDATAIDKARKGAYVDAVVIIRQMQREEQCKHENINSTDGLDECQDCGARNY